MGKRLFALILSAVLLVNAFPATAIEISESDSKNMPKLELLEEYSGQCGDNVFWRLNTISGELVFSGSGEMWNYPAQGFVPWSAYRGSVKNIIIGDGITSISDYAFYLNSALTVSIPNSVITIGCEAFSGCQNINNIRIPNGIEYIKGRAFAFCKSLNVVYVDRISTWCNIQFEEPTSNPLSNGNVDLYVNNDLLTDLIIPEQINNIGNYTFYKYQNLIEVTTHDNVKSIGDAAFLDCRNLKKIRLSSSLKYIGNSAFSGCSLLGDVVLPDTLLSLGSSAFSMCVSLSEITLPDNITRIEASLFDGCDNLGKVNLPQNLIYIGSRAFFGCNLKNIKIPSSLTTVGASAFTNAFDPYTGEKGVYISDLASWCSIEFESASNPLRDAKALYLNDELLTTCKIPDNISSISNYAFYGCESITSVVMNNEITEIGKGAFRDCINLTSIELSTQLSSIAEELFYNCKKLKNIILPNGITKVGVSAFSGCESIEILKLPDTISLIGGEAFASCRNLENIIIPPQVTVIAYNTFYCCSNLQSVELPDGLTSIGMSAFSSCRNLKEICFPNSLEDIGEGAFRECDSLQNVRFPDKLNEIDRFLFLECEKLHTITFGNKINTINARAFKDCPNLIGAYFYGNAPSVYEADVFNCSFAPNTTLYYIEGTSGWTDSDAYDAETGTWNGYPLSTWVPTDLTITPLVEKEIEVNGSGKARMYFSLTDYIGNPVVGRAVTCSVQMREYHSVTDGNGVFSVQIPASTGKYPVQISVDGFEDILNGAIQTVSVTSKDLSYSQKWEASLGAELGASIGPSVSASVGVAEFEAAAAKAAANAGIGSTFSIENSYENGVRTLELTTQYDVSAGVEFKSGVEATAPSVTIKPVTLSAGASYMEQTSAGLKIQNYDPHNMDHLIKAGSFYLQTALLGMHSVWAQRFLDLLDIKAHNQSAYTNKITLEAGASLGALESGGESITVAGADAKLSIAAEQSTDYLEKTRSNALDLKTELGCGLLKVPSAAVSGYAIGLGGTNSLKAEVTYASDQTAQELSYTYYEAGEQDIAWLEAVEESKTKLSYKEEQLDKIAEAHPVLGSLLAQRRLIIPPIELIPALQSISMDDIIGEVEHIDVEKTGASFSIPFGIDLGVGASIKLKGTFVEELSYTRSTGVVTSGTEYITSESDDHSAELWAQKQSLDELVTEPVRAAFDELASLFTDVRDYIVNGVKNGLATITGKVSKWFVNVTRIIAGETQSYTILTLQSEDEPDSNAAVAVTVGEPYQVAIYTDETQDTLVPDDELGDNSVILTMNYTPELLEEAGASADAVLQIYRFIPERNSYVLVPGCVLNKKEMMVMVKIRHQGEYILATDSASPLISDFALSDQTPTPTLTVLVSDMSGFKEFRFWIDDREDLVTIDNMDAHYDASTGVFTYRFTEALAGGTHTAYFQAMDKLENANQEPFAFTFTIDAAPPEIATVTVPEGTATDAQGFQVTAQVSDDAALSQVMLNATLPDGKTLHLTMEEQEDGSFAATVAPLSGAGTVTLQVVAVDQAGNRTQSADYTVPISIPAEKTGLYLGAKRTGTELAVTVHNAQPKALGAWLVAAAYDARGAMVDLQSSYVGLTGNTSKTYDLSFACGAEKIASAAAFLVDVSNGYVPLTAERIS